MMILVMLLNLVLVLVTSLNTVYLMFIRNYETSDGTYFVTGTGYKFRYCTVDCIVFIRCYDTVYF